MISLDSMSCHVSFCTSASYLSLKSHSTYLRSRASSFSNLAKGFCLNWFAVSVAIIHIQFPDFLSDGLCHALQRFTLHGQDCSLEIQV